MNETNHSEDSLKTIVMNTSSANYDTNGAMLYIIVVLVWYSVGIVLILAMQMSSHPHEIEDSAKRRARSLIRNLSDHYNTKEILEELANKKNRDRLWNIYMGTNTKDGLVGAENLRIRHIEKQLATIKRNHRLTHDGPFLSTDEKTSCLHNRSVSSVPLSTVRRRSSFDQQVLDRWKQLDNQSKLSEQQLIWSNRKTTIRKYFRRDPKKSIVSQSSHTNPTTNEPIDFVLISNPIPKVSHRRIEATLSSII